MHATAVFIAFLFALFAASASAQSLTFAEVLAGGANPLSVSEAKQLMTGAKTEFALVNGSQRFWTNASDGTFVASRSNGPRSRMSSRGTWTINKDAACRSTARG
jgi:hypothetical protein